MRGEKGKQVKFQNMHYHLSVKYYAWGCLPVDCIVERYVAVRVRNRVSWGIISWQAKKPHPKRRAVSPKLSMCSNVKKRIQPCGPYMPVLRRPNSPTKAPPGNPNEPTEVKYEAGRVLAILHKRCSCQIP